MRTRNNYKAEILGSVCHSLRMRDSGGSPGEKKVRLASGGLGDEGHDDGEFKASLGYLVSLYLKNTGGWGLPVQRTGGFAAQTKVLHISTSSSHVLFASISSPQETKRVHLKGRRTYTEKS